MTIALAGAKEPRDFNVDPDQGWFQPDPATTLQSEQLARTLDCDPALICRLVMRGCSSQEVLDYLNPAPQHVRHPEETMPGMLAAAAALWAGIRRGEPVAVYADYDVDGQTAMAILAKTLADHGASVHQGSANAKTGFGLSRAFVEESAAAGSKWLVTVDCGSTQTDPVRLARSLGMKVIVVDHHDVDRGNEADFHLNPRLLAADALAELAIAVDESPCRQSLEAVAPYDAQVARLTDRSLRILESNLGSNRLGELLTTIERFAHPKNTGSVLTWKFAAALYLVTGHKVPSSHWGRPMYLAGLGAIADLAPCDDIEVRAFVRVPCNTALQHDRFDNREVVPAGVGFIGAALDEDPLRPDNLVRTRALLNLPKRSPQIEPAQIQVVLRAEDGSALRNVVEELLAAYERLSAVRRDQMDPEALLQVADASDSGTDTYFATAVLNGFEEYSGYARMVANTLVKATGKPAVVFVGKGEDEFGQRLYKFSGANNIVPEAHLGELIVDQAMRAACQMRIRDWLGAEVELANIGGHSEVVSGVCCAENIAGITAAAEAWAARLDKHKKWRPVERKRPRIVERLIDPARYRRLEREGALLGPLGFPTAPGAQVSVSAAFRELTPDPESGHWQALMRLADGDERVVSLGEELAAMVRTNPNRRWEAIVLFGGGQRPFISNAYTDSARRGSPQS